jgi:hypothetical protein
MRKRVLKQRRKAFCLDYSIRVILIPSILLGFYDCDGFFLGARLQPGIARG